MDATGEIAEHFLVPSGKIRCFVTDKLRPDTPEEQVRQRIARSLVNEYGYPIADLGISVTIQLGRAKKQADLVVFAHDHPHTQLNARIIIETKREETKPTDRDNGIQQLHSYMAACPNADWGLWIGSEIRAFRRQLAEGLFEFLEEPDIPPHGRERPPRLRFDQLVPAEALKPVLRRIHNYIYANQGLPKDQAFHELLKLIFCKVYDEETTRGEMQFDIDADERLSELGQRRLRLRLEDLFSHVRHRFPHIFEQHENIRLDNRVLAYAVSELRRYSLLSTPTDIKGEAYQELIRDNLRGDRGEFFTPASICRMAVEMTLNMVPEAGWSELKVLDPACGTGGFLRSFLDHLRESLIGRELEKGVPGEVAYERVLGYLRDVAERNIYGIDINPLLVRTSQMNLVMHGDGSSNIFHANGLAPASSWRPEMKSKLEFGSVDLVITNPPFGSGPGLAVDDPHYLEQFEIARWGASRGARTKMPPEQLFIERCYQFLRPGGLMAIVLPDSILSNPGLTFIRDWMLARMKIIASVDLPVETFVAFGGTGTQTSVLIAQRLTKEEERQASVDYDVFMAIPRTMGYDRRGNDLWRRTPEGEIEWEESVELSPDERMRVTQRRVRDDEVSEVAPAFQAWLGDAPKQAENELG